MAALNSIIWKYHRLFNPFSVDGTFRLFPIFCYFKQSRSEKSCTDIISPTGVSIYINTVNIVKWTPKATFSGPWVPPPLSPALSLTTKKCDGQYCTHRRTLGFPSAINQPQRPLIWLKRQPFPFDS